MTAGSCRPSVSVRISVTDRCPMRCVYCMPPEGVAKRHHEDILSFEEIVRFVRALQAGFRVRTVRLTGGEPLARRNIVELVGMLGQLNLRDLALTTNGQSLAELACSLRQAGLHRVNVSLDGIREDTYRRITRGGDLGCTLRGIEAAQQAGLAPLKTNTVVVRGYNDEEVPEIVRFALAHGCQARFLELMPLGPARADYAARFVPAAEIRARVEQVARLSPLRRGDGTSRDFTATDNQGRTTVVGFIAGESEPFCEGCTRVRLTSTGSLIACLARGEGSDIRPLLREDSPSAMAALIEMLGRALAGKCPRGEFESPRPMSTVGG